MALLPFACAAALGLTLTGFWQQSEREPPGWQRVLLWTAAFVSAYLVLVSELLSLISSVNLLALVIAWSVPLLLLLWLAVRQPWMAAGARVWQDKVSGIGSWHWTQIGLLALMSFEALLLLAVALKAAPNTADSLLYHMSRVAHWRQNQSLDHYAAVYHHQLWSPIFSELAILNLTVLWGADQPANLVQYFSMLGSLAAVTGISRQLGGGRRTRLLAAAIAFSAPMALLQATSTQTDYVVGFWSVATLFFLIRLIKRGLQPLDWLALGASIGLGMLSKVTYYPLVGLLLIGGFVLAWRAGRRWQSLIGYGMLAAFLAILLNLGFWSRNIQTYGTPLGDRDMLTSNTDLSLDPRAPFANGLQHLALNYVSPWPSVNDRLTTTVNSISAELGQAGDRLQVLWGWNHEDLAGSPLHVTLLLLSILLSLLPGPEQQRHRWYAGALLLSFLGFAWAVDAGVHRVRYQVPWLLMGAPLTAIVISNRLRQRWPALVAAALLLLALPWVLFNQTRPVIGWQPRTRVGSVFTTSRAVSLFANAPRARQHFSQAAAAATSGSCQRVGLRIDAIDIEYTFWWLLTQQEPEVQIRIVRPLPDLAHLQRSEFEPCSILCTNCQGDDVQGFDLEASFGPVKVFR